MSKHRDFLDMIEIIDRAIEAQHEAGNLFRHNSRPYDGDTARSLYLEIAGDFIQFREKLQSRKRRLIGALNDVKEANEKTEKVKTAVLPVNCFRIDQPKNYISSIQRDPVCDMRVNPEDCQNIALFRGKRYYFCCDDCQRAFELTPEKYVKN